MSSHLEVKVAVVEERLDTLEEEQLRHRARLHDLESDRATLRIVVEQVKELTATVERTAKRAAQEAIDLAMEHRDEIGRRRWGLRLQWFALGVGVCVLIVSVLALILSVTYGGGS